MEPISFQILGIGCWGPDFENWPELQAIFSDPNLVIKAAESQLSLLKGPKPEIIPANERRRAPLPVRLAIESSWQATQHANIAPDNLLSVFVSGIGDTQLTDYMCKTLAGENKALSPTKFHNSVHNAAAGYWTISTGCKQAANSVAGFQESVPLALMEALLQCQTENRPVLVTFYDAPSSDVLMELLDNESAFSASIVICPADASSAKPHFLAAIADGDCQWPNFQSSNELEDCYSSNPAAKILPLLEVVAQKNINPMKSIAMPLSSERHLIISSEPQTL